MDNKAPTYFTDAHAISMELRDYFAAKALVSAYPKMYDMFLEEVFDDWHGDGIESLAKEAYLIADAMMKAREA